MRKARRQPRTVPQWTYIDEVLVVPQKQRTLGHLEVRTADALRQDREQQVADLGDLLRLHQLQHFLHLVQHDN